MHVLIAVKAKMLELPLVFHSNCLVPVSPDHQQFYPLAEGDANVDDGRLNYRHI